MLVFRKCQVLDKMQNLREHFNQTLYLTGRIIRVLGPPRVLGPRSVLSPPRVLGPRSVLSPPRVLGPHRVLVLLGSWVLQDPGPYEDPGLGPGSCFSGMPCILYFSVLSRESREYSDSFLKVGTVNYRVNPVGNYMFKVNNRKTRTRCEICSELTMQTPERHQWCGSGVFVVNFEHISHLVLSFLLLLLSK